MHKSTLTIGIILMLSACAVGPDYRRPEIAEPTTFVASRSAPDQLIDEQRFWAGFGDPLLAELIKETLDANLSLAAALARYDRAAALLAGANREHWPSVSAAAQAARLNLSDFEAGDDADAVDIREVGLIAEWELDLFGRLRRISESRHAELQAAAADVDAVRVALTGQLATSYFQLRGLQQQYEVAQANARLQEESLAIVKARVAAGQGTTFDQVRASAQLERVRSRIPTLRAEIDAAMHRISVISGRPPTALVERLSPVQALPRGRPLIAAGTPGELLRRRPDVAAAERRVAAATARIGIATADLYPRFNFSGLFGSLAGNAGDLFSGGAQSSRVALGIHWSFLDRGRVQARIDAADAETREAIAVYRQAVLFALEATETRLRRYQRSQQRTTLLERAAEASERAVALARTRHERGYIAYFEVLAAEQELITARDEAVTSRTAEVLAMVDVYRALAGAPPSD